MTIKPEFDLTLFAAAATCVEDLGRAGFEEALLTLLRHAARIEQCMIFVYADEQMDYVLASNDRSPGLATRLARLYVQGQFRHDPHYARLRAAQLDPGGPLAAVRMQAEAMSPAYRSHFFSFPDLVDKVSLCIPHGTAGYYLNLYRGRREGEFTAADLARLDGLAPLLASLIRRHYTAPNEDQVLQPSASEAAVLAPLSERERQVCLRLLRGHTLKSAAADLGVALSSAETYRKRAYEKLGVPSRARLVALTRGK